MRSTLSRLAFPAILAIGLIVYFGCSKSDSSSSSTVGQGSEIAASVMSGTVANSETSTAVGRFTPVLEKETNWASVASLLPNAEAASFTCTGGSFSSCSGGVETYTPPDCAVTYSGGTKTVTSTWTNGPFTFTIGGSGCTCSNLGSAPNLMTLSSSCNFARTTASTGITRTITGPKGNAYAVTSNTTTPSGYDTSVTTFTSGVVTSCTNTTCASGRSVVINGTHITATVDGSTLWDHTVSTEPSAPIVVTGTGANRVIASGRIVVQHNLAKFTSTSVVNGPLNHTAGCCFPVSGSLTTTFSGGTWAGKTETITFGSTCGEATLAGADGSTSSITLTQCL